MYKTIMEGIEGVGIYPIISLILFFGVFTGMLWWVFKMDRHHIDHMGQLPLESDASINFEGDGNHGN